MLSATIATADDTPHGHWQLVGNRFECHSKLLDEYEKRVEDGELSLAYAYNLMAEHASYLFGPAKNEVWGVDFTYRRSDGRLVELPRFWLSLEVVPPDWDGIEQGTWVPARWRQVLPGRGETRQVDSIALANFSAENYEAMVKLLEHSNGVHQLFVATATDLGAWFQIWDTKTGALMRWSKSAGATATLIEWADFNYRC